MAISTSTSSPLPLLFLHRAAANPSPTALSFPSSLRASPLRSRAAAATPPAETLSDDHASDAPPAAAGTGIPMPSSIGDDGEQLLFGATAGKETIMSPCAQLHSSSDYFSMSQEKIVTTNSYGEKLVGVLHDTGSKDIIVLCHGFRSSKEIRTILGLADALTSEKISVSRFDFAGNGESEGTFQYGNYNREVDDLRDVILHFEKHKCDTRAIAGHSKGGSVVILYASMYRDVSSVINMSGRFDLKSGIGDQLGNDYM